MHLFRAKFLVAMIALFFLGVIAERVFGNCEPPAAQTAGESGQPAHSDEHNCQCICHHTFVNQHPVLDLRVAMVLDFSFVPERADSPPDAIPLGIDHPPQLA